MFDFDDFLEKVENSSNSSNNRNSGVNNNRKFNKNKINIWDKNTKIEPLEIDLNNLNSEKKYVTIMFPSMDYEIGENERRLIIGISELLNKNNYILRTECNTLLNLKNDIVDNFNTVYFIKPWEKYCKEKGYTPSDDNIRAAAKYSKNYNNLPPAIKLIKAAHIATLYGLRNSEPTLFVITHDRNYDGKKIDFAKSKIISDIYMLEKTTDLPVNVINLARNEDIEKIKKILS